MANWIWKKYNATANVTYTWRQYNLETETIYSTIESDISEEYQKISGPFYRDYSVSNGKFVLENQVYNSQISLGANYYGKKESDTEIYWGNVNKDSASTYKLFGKKKYTITPTYKQLKGSYRGNVTSTDATAYPTNGKSGSYWYDTRTSSTSYSQGSYIGEVTAEETAFTDNARHSDGYWYVKDRPANVAPTISGEDTNLGEKNQPFEIQYSVEDKDITDNVTVTEHLNNRQIRRITNANNTEQTLKITSELLNSCPLGETNTIKIYAEDEKGAGTYRNYWFKRTNTPPYFVEENQDLGTVTKAPTITFTAKDDDGDKYLKAKVKINQRVVKVYDQLGNGEQVSFTLDWKDFMQLHHSRKHNLWVEVEDSSGALATLKYTFERDTKKIEIATNTAPLDIKVKLMVFNANIKLGEGATFLQYACNDFGTKNTWEKIENGVPHEFTNKHEGEDVIGYKCELTKGTGESEIRSIGGSFI